MESSLLHFNHYGTEDEVSQVLTGLFSEKEFNAIAYPPRDLDRLQSVYLAAKRNNKMLVVPPNQAVLLDLFNGLYKYPKLSHKNIGTVKPPKVTGSLEDRDYSYWEKSLYDSMKPWDGHQNKRQYVTLDDIARNPEQFVTFISEANMDVFLNQIARGKKIANGQFIRSHPAPWNAEMMEQEKRHIRLQENYGIYAGPTLDYLDVKYVGEMFARKHLMPTVHVTGHHSKEETKMILDQLPDNIVIGWYHGMNVSDIKEIAGKKRIFVPERGRPMALEEVIENAA